MKLTLTTHPTSEVVLQIMPQCDDDTATLARLESALPEGAAYRPDRTELWLVWPVGAQHQSAYARLLPICRRIVACLDHPVDIGDGAIAYEGPGPSAEDIEELRRVLGEAERRI